MIFDMAGSPVLDGRYGEFLFHVLDCPRIGAHIPKRITLGLSKVTKRIHDHGDAIVGVTLEPVLCCFVRCHLAGSPYFLYCSRLEIGSQPKTTSPSQKLLDWVLLAYAVDSDGEVADVG
jgi:hypothetical protein